MHFIIAPMLIGIENILESSRNDSQIRKLVSINGTLRISVLLASTDLLNYPSYDPILYTEYLFPYIFQYVWKQIFRLLSILVCNRL